MKTTDTVLADEIYWSFTCKPGSAHSCSKCHSLSTLMMRHLMMIRVLQRCCSFLFGRRGAFKKGYVQAWMYSSMGQGVVMPGLSLRTPRGSATCLKYLVWGWHGCGWPASPARGSGRAWGRCPGWSWVGMGCKTPLEWGCSKLTPRDGHVMAGHLPPQPQPTNLAFQPGLFPAPFVCLCPALAPER